MVVWLRRGLIRVNGITCCYRALPLSYLLRLPDPLGAAGLAWIVPDAPVRDQRRDCAIAGRLGYVLPGGTPRLERSFLEERSGPFIPCMSLVQCFSLYLRASTDSSSIRSWLR